MTGTHAPEEGRGAPADAVPTRWTWREERAPQWQEEERALSGCDPPTHTTQSHDAL